MAQSQSRSYGKEDRAPERISETTNDPANELNQQVVNSPNTESGTAGQTPDEIATRAYECWHERGCPEGSPEVDWHRAEDELKASRQTPRKSRAAATA